MDFSFLNDAVTDVFGETVAWRRLGEPDVPIFAIYDSRHYQNEDGEADSSDLVTTVSIRSADAPLIKVEEEIVARGITYRVSDLRRDGQGMLTAALERVS